LVVTTPEPSRPATLRAVAEALDLPPARRADSLMARLTTPAEREEAERLLHACERAAGGSLLDTPAAELAAPLLADLAETERAEAGMLSAALAGRYTIQRELGRGGQATVYLARDERHRRPVALKVLHTSLVPGGDPTRAVAWFGREIELAARLAHPHIVPVFDSGSAGGRLFFITPYVDGENLRDYLARHGRMPLDAALRVLRDVCRALSCAHRHGVVHRDIKPANILLTGDGDALVSDFGVAKGLAAATEPAGMPGAHGDGMPDNLTDGGLIIGTPLYLSPEQAAGGRDIDHRADLYGLGIVAYELLTGATPFPGLSRDELLMAHLARSPEPVRVRNPEIPPALATLVDRLIAKRPGDRPRDAAEVLHALDEALSGLRHMAVGNRARSSPDREAVALYEKGRYLLSMRQRDSLLTALQYFERAIARDATFARAYVGMADCWSLLGTFGHVETREAFTKSRMAAEHAIALDSELAEAHATLAHHLFLHEWNWQDAGPALERAIALDPGYPLARMFHASYLHSVGRPEEALAQLAVAQALDPLHPAAVLTGRIYVDTGRPDEAIRILRELIDLDPRRDLAHELLAHAYLQKGMNTEAVDSMLRAAALSGARDSAQLAYVYAMIGNPAEARNVISRLVESGARLDQLGFHLAMAYAGLGEVDEVFRWLEAAYLERGGFMNLIGVSYAFKGVRSDPRFADLLQRMGLKEAES
jgi:serine/threonine protein kinase/Flp pilus assembly protein TadD